MVKTTAIIRSERNTIKDAAKVMGLRVGSHYRDKRKDGARYKIVINQGCTDKQFTELEDMVTSIIPHAILKKGSIYYGKDYPVVNIVWFEKI